MLLVARTDAEDTSPALVLAYTAAYAVGSVMSYAVLRRVGSAGCGPPSPGPVPGPARRSRPAIAPAAAAARRTLLHRVADDPHWAVAAAVAR